MIRFVAYHDKTYKVVFEDESAVWLVDCESPSAPIKVALPNELTDAPIPGDYLSEETPSAKRNKAMERRYEILRPLIEEKKYIYDSSMRREKAREISLTSGISVKTLIRLYFIYLAKGKRGLLPASKSAAVKNPDACDLFRYKSEKMKMRHPARDELIIQ